MRLLQHLLPVVLVLTISREADCHVNSSICPVGQYHLSCWKDKCKGGDECCSKTILYPWNEYDDTMCFVEGEGDCDDDDECHGPLRCGENNCLYNWKGNSRRQKTRKSNSHMTQSQCMCIKGVGDTFSSVLFLPKVRRGR